jgi:hypothetical protein
MPSDTKGIIRNDPAARVSTGSKNTPSMDRRVFLAGFSQERVVDSIHDDP